MSIEISWFDAAQEAVTVYQTALESGVEFTDAEESAYKHLCAAVAATKGQEGYRLVERTRIVIHIEGGLVQQVIADRDCQVLVVDYDNEESEQCEAESTGTNWIPDRSWGKPDCIDAAVVQRWADARENEG